MSFVVVFLVALVAVGGYVVTRLGLFVAFIELFKDAVEAWWIDGSTDLILRAVRGENMFVHARLPETVPAVMAPILEKELANEAAFGAKLENWLAQRSKR